MNLFWIIGYLNGNSTLSRWVEAARPLKKKLETSEAGL